MTTFFYREGTTEPIDITLKDGSSAADITGYTSIGLFLRSGDGSHESEASSTDNGITVTSASAGTIQLHPSLLTSALLYSEKEYRGYIIVVDGSSKRSSFPSDGEFVIKMLERYAGDG